MSLIEDIEAVVQKAKESQDIPPRIYFPSQELVDRAKEILPGMSNVFTFQASKERKN